jgi:8-oxo-dGTP pyrophosphatase MutT (NUDIX family)
MDLDVAGLRLRLSRPGPAGAVYGDDGTGREEAATVAAVLVPIIARPAGLTVLFTQRTAHLKAHSGQVSFPGGRAEPGDASPEETALRESEEEIGLPRDRVEVLARLPEYFTRTGFRVTPVIGLIAPPVELVPDPREVESIFEVPLAFLLDASNHKRQTREFQGRTVGYYEMPYGNRYIWGATAGMVVNLYRALAD